MEDCTAGSEKLFIKIIKDLSSEIIFKGEQKR